MSRLISDSNGNVVQTIKPNMAKIQNVTTGAGSVPTTNPIEGTGAERGDIAMLISTTDCWFNIGAAPVAAKDNTSIFLPAKVYFYIEVKGGVTKVAFIQDSAPGVAQVIPAAS